MKSSTHTDEIHKLQRSGIGNTEWMKTYTATILKIESLLLKYDGNIQESQYIFVSSSIGSTSISDYEITKARTYGMYIGLDKSRDKIVIIKQFKKPTYINILKHTPVIQSSLRNCLERGKNDISIFNNICLSPCNIETKPSNDIWSSKVIIPHLPHEIQENYCNVLINNKTVKEKCIPGCNSIINPILKKDCIKKLEEGCDIIERQSETYLTNKENIHNKIKNEAKMQNLFYKKNSEHTVPINFLEDDEYFYIISDLIHGINLYDFIKNCKRIDAKIYLLYKIDELLRILIQNKISHCDFRLNNIIITIDGELKLIDFEYASEYDDHNSHILNRKILEELTNRNVIDEFEINHCNNNSDIYSYGRILEFIFTGKFRKKNLSGGFDEKLEINLQEEIENLIYSSPNKHLLKEQIDTQVNMMNQKISISLNRYINTILDGYNNSSWLIGEGHPRPYNDFQLPPTLIAKSKDEIKRIVTTIFNSKYELYINLLGKSSNPDIFFTKENLTGGAKKSIYHYTIPKFIRL